MWNDTKRQQVQTAVAHRYQLVREADADQIYDLFQQALVDRSAVAWETIYALYLPLMRHWMQRQPTFMASGEEADDFANRAFEKMWRSITPAKFANFPDLKSVLKYLKLCVHSVWVDFLRIEKRYALESELGAEENAAPDADVAAQYCDSLQRQEFWAQIQARLKNDKERQLLYYRYVLGIKPNSICQQYSDTFASPDEVYTMTQNILARLRRDQDLQLYLNA